MNNQIVYEEYVKMSDDIFIIDKFNIIRFNLNLLKYDDKGQEYPFHTEYMYNRFDNTNILIRRKFDYYLSIESIYNHNREFVMITSDMFMLFKYSLDEVLKWFRDEKYKDLFLINKDGQLKMTTHQPQYEIANLPPRNKKITWRPIILNENTYNAEIGVSLEYGNIVCNMPIQKFMGLYYTLYNFNMLLSAQMMMAYIGRPYYGYNMVDLTSKDQVEEQPTSQIRTTRRLLNDKNTIEDLI